MSVTIMTDIFCDICTSWDSDVTVCSYRSRTREALQKAHRRGWIRKKQDGKIIDICPACQQTARLALKKNR